MWDEITKNLQFDTRTLKWVGVSDYGGVVDIMIPNGMADHVLVVFRPYLGGWIQPEIRRWLTQWES